MKNKLTNLISGILWRPFIIAVAMIVIFTLTRISLLIYTGYEYITLGLFLLISFKGLLFDIIAAIFLLSPFFIYEVFFRGRAAGRIRKIFSVIALWMFFSFILFIAVAEFVFWIEFSTRFNFIAVDYLLYTHEVIGNILQSYPVGWIFFGITLLAAVITYILLPVLRKGKSCKPAPASVLSCLLMAILSPIIIYYTISTDMNDGSGNAYADELSGNGILTFFAAVKENELDYDKFYMTIPQDEADEILKKMGVERRPLSRNIKKDMYDPADDVLPLKKRPSNIVLIVVESLSASFLNSYGSDYNITPNLDRLAREGLKFEKVFAAGTRTVRGLEALSLGIPPVPGQSVVRRPYNGYLSTLGVLLKKQGVDSFFIYGGYGYFDNMNAYFKANDYRIIDRSDFPSNSVVFENIWGVADESLYSNAITAIDLAAKEKRPFFATIMTTSNHRPYTYPSGRIDIPSPGGRVGAVKYTDYAIGKFIDESRNKDWFKDTLFIITADHCASVAGKTKLPWEKYLIPLIFYNPNIINSGVFKPIVSQIDLPPTIVEMLGKKGDDYFFGRSFFESGKPLERAFISNYQALGYIRNGILTVLLPKKKFESYMIDSKTFELKPVPVDQKLLKEAIAYYQTASREFKKGYMKFDR
ncbi:MAG: sulfatase-like hydrolase/transferase [Elusimicrobia bacterium]|nr:sulfatase-like hydrolase/transferase [Elusimicrobiota bacterium]